MLINCWTIYTACSQNIGTPRLQTRAGKMSDGGVWSSDCRGVLIPSFGRRQLAIGRVADQISFQPTWCLPGCRRRACGLLLSASGACETHATFAFVMETQTNTRAGSKKYRQSDALPAKFSLEDFRLITNFCERKTFLQSSTSNKQTTCWGFQS